MTKYEMQEDYVVCADCKPFHKYSLSKYVKVGTKICGVCEKEIK